MGKRDFERGEVRKALEVCGEVEKLCIGKVEKKCN